MKFIQAVNTEFCTVVSRLRIRLRIAIMMSS